MSQGLIPVAYPVGVVPEIINSGENGFIVNNLAEAQAAIQSLTNNFDLRQKMSTASRQTAEKFQAFKMAQKMINLYEKISPKK
ncbi:MAG: glycosyltransferase, partial [Patescibacteria group bacterium]